MRIRLSAIVSVSRVALAIRLATCFPTQSTLRRRLIRCLISVSSLTTHRILRRHPHDVTTNTISVIFGRTVVLITEAVEREIRRLLAVTAVVTDRVHSRAEVTDRVGTTTAGQLIRPLSASWPVPMRSLNDSIGCWPSRPTYIGAAWITQYGRIFLTE